jgi:hypothetical protein
MEHELARLERTLAQVRRAVYVSIALSLLACIGVGVAAVLAVRSFGDYATVLHDASTTISAAQQTTLRANVTLSEAEAVLQSARATLGVTKQTIQQAAQTTQQAQSAIQNAPANVLRAIPIVNWFIGQ